MFYASVNKIINFNYLIYFNDTIYILI